MTADSLLTLGLVITRAEGSLTASRALMRPARSDDTPMAGFLLVWRDPGDGKAFTGAVLDTAVRSSIWRPQSSYALIGPALLARAIQDGELTAERPDPLSVRIELQLATEGRAISMRLDLQDRAGAETDVSIRVVDPVTERLLDCASFSTGPQHC